MEERRVERREKSRLVPVEGPQDDHALLAAGDEVLRIAGDEDVVQPFGLLGRLQ